ncbi:hypothetical protein E4T43_03137 [Aureobasidium subglaciale]|nr:hypothetical protein E4T43_03137 [Aureobasidium subglaciale]
MGKGSCYCGKVSFTYEGEPLNKAICHCTDCQKISGSAYTTNIVVPVEGFNVNGTPKKYSAKAATGREVTTVFCGDCGSPLWREGEMSKDTLVVRAGSLDDKGALTAAKPLAEVYTSDRAGWLGEQEGAKQFPEMF